MSMNTPSGQDSPQRTETNAPLQGQLSSESSKKSTPDMGKSFLIPSGARLGEIVSVKNSVVDNLVRVAEEHTQRPVSPHGQQVLAKFIDGATRGYVANLGMTCAGTKCHPSGTKIKTPSGYKNIEDLNTEKDTLISWDRNNNAIRSGYNNSGAYNFTLYKRLYSGPLYTISDGIHSYECTHEHLLTVRWSEKAENAFAVYLMQRGDTWRVGKVKLFSGNLKTIFGPLARSRMEDADKFWILGVYETNTEALLSEEIYSCKYGISKSCFIATKDKEKIKHNGLYKWVTQEQLDIHHKELAKEYSFYRNMLDSLGLCIEHPFMDLNKDYPRLRVFEIAACNVLSNYMECPTEDTVNTIRKRNRKSGIGVSVHKAVWKKIHTKYRLVKSMDVFSIGVEPHKHYIANGLVTHNCPFLSACPLHAIQSTLPVGKRCPVESSLVITWINKHLKALGIEDPDDPVHSFDMDMLYELAGQELVRWRCSVHLSDTPHLVTNQQVGATQQGEPIFADVINPVLEVMDRAGRNISRIREALLATREAQMKAGQVTTDPTLRAAELREKAQKMLASRRKEQEDIKEAEFKEITNEPSK